MNEPLVIGPYHAGEIPPPIVVTFTLEDGVTPVDFTQDGPWTAQFSFRHYGSTWQLRQATVTPSASGEVTYVWVNHDLDTPGDYVGEMWIGNASGPADSKYDSMRLAWQVAPATVPVPSV